MNYLTRLLDERQDGLPYFFPMYKSQPPAAAHVRWDYGDCIGRYIDALKLARIMTGNTRHQRADEALSQWLERLLGEHGLSWWPDPPYRGPSMQPRRAAKMAWTQRGALTGFTTQFAASGDKHFAGLAKSLIDGLATLVVWNDSMAFFPAEACNIDGFGSDMIYPPEGWKSQEHSTDGAFAAMMGSLIWPLARFGQLAGHEPAIDLAGGVNEQRPWRSGNGQRMANDSQREKER